MLILLGVMFITNFSFGVYQARDKNNDYYFASVKPAIEQQNSVFILENEWIIRYYIEYYTSCEIVNTSFIGEDQLISQIDSLHVLYDVIFLDSELYNKAPSLNDNYKQYNNQRFIAIEKK